MEERARASQNERRRADANPTPAPGGGTLTLRADADGTEEDYGDKQVYLTTASPAAPLFSAQGFPNLQFSKYLFEDDQNFPQISFV